eukprot:COSAG03_NODE_19184_length_341_cov_0.995868_1_plen_68_part_10
MRAPLALRTISTMIPSLYAECATLLNELNELRPEASPSLRVQIRDLEVRPDHKDERLPFSLSLSLSLS